MNNTKKIIFMCLIPAILTIFFVVQFTVPSVKHYFHLNKQIKQNKMAIKNTKNSVEMLKANKRLANDLDKLNTELIGFDIEFPSKFKDEIILIDMEIFANEAVNRIVGLQTLSEKEVEIVDPGEAQDKKRKRRTREKKISPVQIFEKAFEVNTVAYYNEVIDFVNFLEDYQRKVNISGVSAKIFDEDNESPNPRIELKIAASTYKSAINEIVNEIKESEPQQKVSKKEKAKNAKSKKK